ncbi:MAG: J domain-containing protein [Verrucomicrobiota bacterium]
MTIARRFLNMARSELNSLLDIAAKHTDDDDGADRDGERESLHGFSATELEEELERRRSARQEVEDAIHGRRSPEPPPPRAAGTGAGAGRRPTTPAGGGGEALKVQKAYATLEVPIGSDFQTVRKSYRALMRKYHPDHHTQSPEKQRAANEVAQRLTDAYRLLEKKLRT